MLSIPRKYQNIINIAIPTFNDAIELDKSVKMRKNKAKISGRNDETRKKIVQKNEITICHQQNSLNTLKC